MIELLILFLHIVVAIYVFTKNWQEFGKKEGFLAVAVLALVFIVGWSISGAISRVIYPESCNFMFFNEDTFALCLLLIPEIFFFRFYFLKNTVEAEIVDKKS